MSVEPNKASWLVGSGEGMAARIRAHDWSSTPLGPIDAWPPGLRVAVNLMLTNGFPVAIAWGPGAIVLYNDGYAGIIGTRHPDALGQSVHTVFPEMRDAYGPILDCVWQGETVTQYDQPYRLWRNGRLDEAWFTVSYSPLRDEQGQVSGVLMTLFETTARLLAERRHDDMERELRERESRYHTLFDAMEEGVGIIERIESAPGQLTNFRCVLGNPVFARLSGVDDAVGKTMRDVLPGEPEAWFETYETVLRTGEPARFERDLVTIGRTVDVYAFRIDDGTQRRVAIVIRDITARQRGEAERERLLLEVEYERARQAFLLKLSDALRPLADPGAIQAEANRILGEHLQVDRAFYVEVDMVNQVSIVEQDYVCGNLPSLAGRHALVHYGPVVDVMREGRPLVVEDVETAPMILESQRPAYAALPIRSFMAVPIIKHGDYVAVMATTDVNLRAWTAEDLTLLQDVAERTWEAVERSRAEAAARESEERQAFLLSLSDALRPLADPGAIQSTALHLLGEHLGVDRAFYAEIVTDGGIDYYRLDRDYHTPRTPSIVGRHPVSAFGRVVVDTYRAGRWMAVSDVEADEALAPADCQAFAAIGVCAFIGVPLIKDGSFVATLGVNQFEARAWQPAEIVLVEAVAERTWAAVERARAEEALRQSEERLQKAMSTDTVGVLFFDLHGHFADANETFERMSGYTREELCESVHWTALTPLKFMDLTERMVDDLAAYGKAPPYEKQMIRKDGSRWWGLFAPTRLSGTGRESEVRRVHHRHHRAQKGRGRPGRKRGTLPDALRVHRPGILHDRGPVRRGGQARRLPLPGD